MMNKIRNFDVIFPGQGGMFKAGENLVGRLNFSLTERMTVKDVSVTINGKAEVSFQAGKYTYSKKEKYIKEVKTLFVPEEPGVTHLEPGEYSYDFHHRLDTNIPSSFEGKYGHVRYSVDAKIDRGIWKPAITKSKKFIVKNEHDLNRLSGIQDPVRYESASTDGCCCWKRGNLDVTVRLPRKGYVPGDSILLDVDVNNATNTRGYISVELAQFTSFYTRSGSKRWKHVIQTRPRVSVAAGETIELSQEPINIPQLPPSGLPWCKLVDIVYTLRVKVKVRGLECKIPINVTIGTIPLRSVFGTPMLTPPPYQQNPEPFTALWQHPITPPTSLPSPWDPYELPDELPPSPPGYIALASQSPTAIEPPSYEESQQRRSAPINMDL